MSLEAYSFNQNYDVANDRAIQSLDYDSLANSINATNVKSCSEAGATNDCKAFSCSDCYGYLSVRAVVNFQLTGTSVFGIVVPSGLKRFEAYVQGDARFKLDYSFYGLRISTTLGPVMLYQKGAKPLYTFQAVMGVIPVKISFNFELKAQMDLNLVLTLPAPISGGAYLRGSVRAGGLYENGNFTPIKEWSFQHSYRKPLLSNALMNSTLGSGNNCNTLTTGLRADTDSQYDTSGAACKFPFNWNETTGVSTTSAGTTTQHQCVYASWDQRGTANDYWCETVNSNATNPKWAWCTPECVTNPGTVQITLIPIVHITFYDVVPVELEFRPYVGLELEKYAASTAISPTRKCSGQDIDLWYSLYWGMNFRFGIRQPRTPSGWKVIPDLSGTVSLTSTGIFDDIALACRESTDTSSITGSLGSLWSGTKTLLPGGTTVIKNNCTAPTTWWNMTADVCLCTYDQEAEKPCGDMTCGLCSRDRPACGTAKYFLRYPHNGYLRILSKAPIPASICSRCTGCLGNMTWLVNLVKAYDNFDFSRFSDATVLSNFKTEAKTRLAAVINQHTSAFGDLPNLTVANLNVAVSAARRGANVNYDIDSTDLGYSAKAYEDAVNAASSSITAAIQEAYDTTTPSPSPTGGSGGNGDSPSPSPSPSPPSPTVLRQAVEMTDISVAQYTGDLKLCYELAYGHTLSLLNATRTGYLPGVTITSSAARRAATVTFETTVSGTSSAPRPTAASAAAAVTGATLVAAINTVKSANPAQFSNVTTPLASAITPETPTVTSGSTGSSGSSDDDTVVIVVVVVVVLLVIGVGTAVAVYFLACQPKTVDKVQPTQIQVAPSPRAEPRSDAEVTQVQVISTQRTIVSDNTSAGTADAA